MGFHHIAKMALVSMQSTAFGVRRVKLKHLYPIAMAASAVGFYFRYIEKPIGKFGKAKEPYEREEEFPQEDLAQREKDRLAHLAAWALTMESVQVLKASLDHLLKEKRATKQSLETLQASMEKLISMMHQKEERAKSVEGGRDPPSG